MVQIETIGLSLGYKNRKVLENINFKVKKGDFISIIGPSGEGKTTLLMAINGTTKIFEGQLYVLGETIHNITNSSLKKLRSKIGVIFQTFNLVKRLSVIDNIASGMLCRIGLMPAIIKYYSDEQYGKIYEYAKIVGLEKEMLKRCDMLSGGQMQRVAIARALAQEPEIILADEPISSLDPISARRIMEILKNINERYGITIISNLHQIHYAREYCSRIIGINKGRIVYDGAPQCLTEDVIEKIYSGNGEHIINTDERIYYPEPVIVNA